MKGLLLQDVGQSICHLKLVHNTFWLLDLLHKEERRTEINIVLFICPGLIAEYGAYVGFLKSMFIYMLSILGYSPFGMNYSILNTSASTVVVIYPAFGTFGRVSRFQVLLENEIKISIKHEVLQSFLPIGSVKSGLQKQSDLTPAEKRKKKPLDH